MKRLLLAWCATLLLSSLTACDSGSSSAGVSGTISGVAATGAAIQGGTVTLKCVAGSPTGGQTTGANGGFTFNVSGVTLPCLARVVATDGATFHSYVDALGNVNITPITEMLLGWLLGLDPATAFDNFSLTTPFDASRKAAAIAAVKTKLDGLGIDTNALGDPLKDLLDAGSHTGLDGILDSIKTKLSETEGSIADLTNQLVQTSPNQGQGLAGYPAAGTYTGVTATGSACSVTVGSDHSVSASVGGQTLATQLDGHYFANAGGEIAVAVIYNAASRFYESTGSIASVDQASTGNPYQNIGLSFDAATGKLIMAHGQKTTDASNNPAAGSNFSFVCAGELYPSGTAIGSTGFNQAAASRFLATGLVGGPYTAPADGGKGACTFSVDASGNASINWAGFTSTSGVLTLPYDWLAQAGSQSATEAVYDIYYNKTTGARVGTNLGGSVLLNAGDDAISDWFHVTLKQQGSDKMATVLANGTSGNAKSVNCRTANDPAAKWAAVAAYAGTWNGTTDRNFKFGGAATCSLLVNADGSVVYTGGDSVARGINAAGGWTPTIANGYASFDKSTAYPAASMDFTGASVNSHQPQFWYAASGASYEYCNNMSKQ
jgi:hypothetical protein